MKNAVSMLTLLLLGILFSAAVAAAQTPRPDHPHARVLRMLEPLKKIQATSAVRPLEIIHLYQQDLNWINETRTRNEFATGLLLQQHVDMWEGEVFGEWKETGVTEYDYSGTRLSMETTFEVGETGPTPLTRTSYAYRGYEGYPGYTEILTQGYQEGAWVNEERTTLNVSNGQITGGVTDIWNGTEWEPSEQFTLVEEASNSDVSRVVETHHMWSGTEWVNTERNIYAGLTIAQLYDYMERLVADVSDYEGMYYSLRSLPNFVAQEWNDGAWVDISRLRSEFTYHVPDGYLMQEVNTTEEWNDGAWTPTSRIVVDYTTSSSPYGPTGLPARTSVEMYDGEAWTSVFVERYISQVDIERIVQATVEADFGEGLQEMSRIRIDWTTVPTNTETPGAPERFELSPNAPNPFTHSTQIVVRLSEPQHVRLAIYDLLGREVAVLADGRHGAGEHRLRWETGNAPSGVYLYRVEAGAQTETRRMVLLR